MIEFIPGGYLTSLLIIVGVVVVILILFYIIRRMHEETIEIESISPTDILSDSLIRDIIIVVGDAGEEGIRQNKLVSILQKPKSTVSRKIKRLHEYGYVIVKRAGRSNVILLTEKGWSTYKRLKEDLQKHE